jgi:hypothetical protein
MYDKVLLEDCSTTYTWGRKYCVEISKTGRYYISYKGGHIPLSKEQEKSFDKILESISLVENKQSLFGKVVELPSSPKLSRLCIKAINLFLKEERNKENKIYLGQGRYIAKDDYDMVIRHYEAVKYGDSIEEEGG